MQRQACAAHLSNKIAKTTPCKERMGLISRGFFISPNAFGGTSPASHFIEIIGFLSPMFRPRQADETIHPCNETIFRFWRRYPETAVGYHSANETAGTPAPKPETVRCGLPASSSPSPSFWLVPRWLVLPITACPALAPSPTTAHHLLCRPPSRSLWPLPTNRF